MPFAVMTRFVPGTDEKRATVRSAHLEYLKARQELLLAAGGLVGADERPYGSLMIVDTEDRAVATALAHGDPFHQNGILSEVRIEPWRKAFYDGQFCG